MLRCPANSITSGKRTEIIMGKMMIEYKIFFWRLNVLKSLEAMSHALDNLMRIPSQVLNKYLPKSNPQR